MKCHTHPTAEATGTCTTCGRAVCVDCRQEVGGLLRCPLHGADSVPLPPPVLPPPPPIPPAPSRQLRSAGLAFFLGLFPGMGHVYLGLYQRSAIIFGIWAAVFALAQNTDAPPFILGTIFLWFFSPLDAVRLARIINRGGIDDDPSELIDARSNPKTLSLTAGVVLILLGLAAWLNLRFDFEFTWISDNWPFVIVIVGAWLVYRALRVRSKPDDTTSPESGEGV
jgi:hypothetical protein